MVMANRSDQQVGQISVGKQIVLHLAPGVLATTLFVLLCCVSFLVSLVDSNPAARDSADGVLCLVEEKYLYRYNLPLYSEPDE